MQFGGRVARSLDLAGRVACETLPTLPAAVAYGPFVSGCAYEHVTVVTLGPFVVSAPVIRNLLTAATPGIETTFTFPATLKRFLVSNRGDTPVSVRYATGVVGDTVTLTPGAAYEEDLINGAEITLYFTAALPSQRIEIVYWT